MVEQPLDGRLNGFPQKIYNYFDPIDGSGKKAT